RDEVWAGAIRLKIGFPDAKYVVLTRHPLATFSSFANSFFDGDYQAAQKYNPLLNRYVPALAKFLRQNEVPFVHVQYENLVEDPETWMKQIYEYLGIPFEEESINYGLHRREESETKGLGDPIGVQQYSRPSTDSVNKWVEELASDPDKLALMQTIVSQLDQADLETIGYPIETFWTPMEEVEGKTFNPKKQSMSRYRLQRKAIIKIRGFAQSNHIFRGLLRKIQLVSNVLLRD
ncbi:MAG TPA: sulfotransferase, partial [Candidatus Hydrogenedentes bacterium]|nr:sulfotransferase [Candidatus Hydrogenedentota bacterium]